jgi:hypothetical protein
LDTLILLLSVTSGRQARDLIREVVSDPGSWVAWDEGRLSRPRYLQVVGMYEVVGNWDLAVFIRTRTNSPGILISQLRREILKKANLRSFPPVHERGGQFGRFQAITVNREQSSLDSRDSSPVSRIEFDNPREYERRGNTRTFIVVDASPNEEHDVIRPETLLTRMHRVVSGRSVETAVECVYVGYNQFVVELMSVQPGATDIAKFNRLIEPSLAELAVLKYTLLCYEYDEVSCGWETT